MASTGGDSATKTLVIVAVVGLVLVCGLGGLLGGGMYWYVQSTRAEAERARAEAQAAEEARYGAWLESLPADHRAAVRVVDEAERVAIELVSAVVYGDAQGPDAATAIALRNLAGGVRPVDLRTRRTETDASEDDTITALTVDVQIAWERAAPTLVRVSLSRAPDGTLTASAMAIVDAVGEDEE